MDDNMKFISNLIPLGDALAKIDENQKLMDTEKINLKDSQGRVLAHSISSYICYGWICSDCRGYIWSFQ